MGSHGPQFDEFHAQSGEHHGGAQHDEFHRQVVAAPGKDDYGDGRKPTAEPLWDDFEWKPMPEKYGRHFDSNFDEPTALDGEHGTWHDTFRGAAARVIVEGADYECSVISTHSDHMKVKIRGRSGIKEVGLTQVTWVGAPSRREAEGGHGRDTDEDRRVGRSSAEAPSAHSRTAAGGGRTPVEVAVEESIFTNKTGERVELDVHKMALSDFHTHTCGSQGCGAKYHVTKRGTAHFVKAASHGGTMMSKSVTSCQNCGQGLTHPKTGKLKTSGGGLTRFLKPIGKTLDDTLADVRKLAADLED